MKLHRFWHNYFRNNHQRGSQTSLRLRRGALILLAFMIMGVAIAFAPGGKGVVHVNAPAGTSHSLTAQSSPLSSPLSIALNTDESSSRRTDPAVSDPDAGDQRNLLRVAAVIAGVLLVTVIVWRQR